jgi:hypothetical protein
MVLAKSGSGGERRRCVRRCLLRLFLLRTTSTNRQSRERAKLEEAEESPDEHGSLPTPRKFLPQ